MESLILSRPVVGFLVGTRAALGFGIGLLIADRIPDSRRKRIAWALIAVGAATTIPAARAVFGKRNELEADRYIGGI